MQEYEQTPEQEQEGWEQELINGANDNPASDYGLNVLEMQMALLTILAGIDFGEAYEMYEHRDKCIVECFGVISEAQKNITVKLQYGG